MTDTQTIHPADLGSLAGLGPHSVGGQLVVQLSEDNAPAVVSHVASHYQRYPGEVLTLYTRVLVSNAAPGFTLQVSLPIEGALGDYTTAQNHAGGLPAIVSTSVGRYLLWRMERNVEAGEKFEYSVEVVVPPTTQDTVIESTAMLMSLNDSDNWRVVESVEVSVKAKSRYLKYLPALYYDDELMGRFLMIFESLWNPIENQIDNIWYYFDPKMTPSDLVPWLATWSDLSLDERWTEAQQRKLLESAARLYRMRGTKRGLVEYLEIYTGRRAVITEHRANNLRLGKDAKFGPSVALGQNNLPHTFIVYLRLPVIVAAEGEDEIVVKRKENDRRRTIESIIESEKPAHTTYTLVIETEE
jgi:phage tail-like protein